MREVEMTVTELPFAYDERDVYDARVRVERAFGVTMLVTDERGPDGWPIVTIIGSVRNVMRILTDDGGWGGMDDEARNLYVDSATFRTP